MTLVEKVEENIARFELLPIGTRVLLGVSGGIDSMVLLDVLHGLSVKRDWDIQIAHFNHLLRGEASDTDEMFVRQAAAKRNVVFHAGRGAVARIARESGVSIEMAGRDARHGFFEETAARIGATRVALAHHADDQVETFWLRLLRGDLGAGLAGMRWKRRIREDTATELVRPLLNIWKSEIIEYARAGSIAFREDLSNADLHFQRNRLRHEVLPTLESYQPRLGQISLRAAEVLSAEKELIWKAALKWLEARQPCFDQLELGLQREIVRTQLLRLGTTPSFDLVEQLRSRVGEPVMISASRRIRRERSGELREMTESHFEYNSEEKRLSTRAPGCDSLGETMVAWAFVPERVLAEPQTEYFDADLIGSSIVLRHWRPGDRFHPSGASAPSKLQDLFTNLKVPAEERRKRLLAQAENGELFWVEGLRIGEKFKVSPATRRVLKWSWRREPASPT